MLPKGSDLTKVYLQYSRQQAARGVGLLDALQPVYVQTVEQNYMDLRQLLLLLEADRLSDSI